MSQLRPAYIQLHIAVVLFGFTAILGRLIHLTEFEIVWFRLLFTCASMLVIRHFFKKLKAIPPKARWRLAGIGILVSLHWICFYGSIKYANVTVSLTVLSTTAFFTSFLEPLIYRTKVKIPEILLGLMIIVGMYLIFSFGGNYTTGIILALLAAIFASVFSVLNRKMVARYQPLPITFIELGAGLVFITMLSPIYIHWFPEATFTPTLSDLGYLLILAVCCTTIAYVLALNALRHLTAFASNLTINLEPVYGIIMAFFLFGENKDMDTGFFAGALIIMSAIFVHPLINRHFNKKKS